MSHSTLELLYSFTLALFLTTALIPLCIRLAPALGLIDQPDAQRKIHALAIPRCGGLAMAIGIALPLLWLLPPQNLLLHLLVGCGLIVAFGLLDDRNNLDYRWKFLGQILAIIVVMHGGLVSHRLPLLDLEYAPQWLAYPLTFMFLLGATNAVNLTDGLDGLAAGTTLLALAVVFALTQQTDNSNAALMALTAIGGILGFLRYNTHPAQVFMGDAGSQFLGFITACLAIQVTQADTSAVSTTLPLLILGLPVLDTLTVMTIRLAQGRSPFAPDRNHLHHQIMAIGFRHNEAVAIIYVLQIMLLGAAFALRFSSDELLLAVYALFAATLLGLLTLARHSGWRLRNEGTPHSMMDRRNILLRKLEWLYRNSAFVVQFFLMILLLAPVLYRVAHGFDLSSLAIILVPVLLISAICYPRFPAWSTRLNLYSASVLSIYLLTFDTGMQQWMYAINCMYFVLVALLTLAMRMTRREHFRLDTQDLLILTMIVIMPLLPFAALSHYAVGEIALRLALLMYSCEFIVGKSNGKKLWPINIIAAVSLLLATVFHSVLTFF